MAIDKYDFLDAYWREYHDRLYYLAEAYDKDGVADLVETWRQYDDPTASIEPGSFGPVFAHLETSPLDEFRNALVGVVQRGFVASYSREDALALLRLLDRALPSSCGSLDDMSITILSTSKGDISISTGAFRDMWRRSHDGERELDPIWLDIEGGADNG